MEGSAKMRSEEVTMQGKKIIKRLQKEKIYQRDNKVSLSKSIDGYILKTTKWQATWLTQEHKSCGWNTFGEEKPFYDCTVNQECSLRCVHPCKWSFCYGLGIYMHGSQLALWYLVIISLLTETTGWLQRYTGTVCVLTSSQMNQSLLDDMLTFSRTMTLNVEHHSQQGRYKGTVSYCKEFKWFFSNHKLVQKIP